MEFYSLKNWGQDFLKQQSERIPRIQIFLWWDEIVGHRIASITKPIYLREGILGVEVKEDTWRAELSYHISTIKKKYQKRLADSKISYEVKGIRFKYNPLMIKKEKSGKKTTNNNQTRLNNKFENKRKQEVTVDNSEERLNFILKKLREYASGKNLRPPLNISHAKSEDQPYPNKSYHFSKVDLYYKENLHSQFITPPDEFQHFDLY